MNKILLGAISAALLGLLAGVANSAKAANGADDLCGGCPKDFKCAIVGGAPACVPEGVTVR